MGSPFRRKVDKLINCLISSSGWLADMVPNTI